MFHMMNEARIGIGMAATMLGMAGYYASLDYAQPPAGPPIGEGGKDARPQCASSSTPTSSACCWRRRPIAKARWR
jgi:butyryl-CoA dehydrogenase